MNGGIAKVRLLDQELNEQLQMDEEGIDSCDPPDGSPPRPATMVAGGGPDNLPGPIAPGSFSQLPPVLFLGRRIILIAAGKSCTNIGCMVSSFP